MAFCAFLLADSSLMLLPDLCEVFAMPDGGAAPTLAIAELLLLFNCIKMGILECTMRAWCELSRFFAISFSSRSRLSGRISWKNY